MEILSLDPPQITDEIFRDTDAYIGVAILDDRLAKGNMRLQC